MSDLYLRPSCYECSYKTLNRKSDITLGDFWGIKHVVPGLSVDKGVSLVIVHSIKGKELLSMIQNNIYSKPVIYKEALRGNPAMTESAKGSRHKRKKFFGVYPKIKNSDRLDKVILRYSQKRRLQGIYFCVRRFFGIIFRRIGLR